MTALLTDRQIEEQLLQLPGWARTGNEIEQVFTFADFLGAIAFVNRLVEPAETAGHHPDIGISWNKVTIHLSTHDAGGLTEKDFSLAKQITDLA